MTCSASFSLKSGSSYSEWALLSSGALALGSSSFTEKVMMAEVGMTKNEPTEYDSNCRTAKLNLCCYQGEYAKVDNDGTLYSHIYI